MWREAFVGMAVVVGAGAAAAQTPPSAWPTTPPMPAPFAPAPVGSPSGLPNSLPPAQPPAAPPTEPARESEEQLIPFDYRLTDLHWGEQGWQLVAGETVLKDFGRREHDGMEALRIIRELRLTQRGTVGSPRPIMEYWLSDGQAPQGPVSGARTLPIDRASLRVENVQGHWWVRDSLRPYFNFGIHEEDARQALGVMQKHRFTHVALVGQALPLMLVFLSQPDAAAPSPLQGPSPLRTPGWTTAAGPKTPMGTLPPATLPNSQMMQASIPSLPTMPGGFPQGGSTPVGFPMGRQMGLPGSAFPGLGSLGTQVPLDCTQTRLDHDAQGWKLVSGGYVVGQFGNNYSDAQMALSTLHYYRFTEHCLIGKGKPAFSYFLVNGQAPRGAMLGVQGTVFHPDSVAVRQVGKSWEITERGQVLFRFGDKGEEAQQALQAIQRHKFDTIYRIGKPEAGGMVVLARTR